MLMHTVVCFVPQSVRLRLSFSLSCSLFFASRGKDRLPTNPFSGAFVSGREFSYLYVSLDLRVTARVGF